MICFRIFLYWFMSALNSRMASFKLTSPFP